MKCFALYLATDAVNNRGDNLALDIKKLEDKHNATLVRTVHKLKHQHNETEKLKQQTEDQLRHLRQQIGKCKSFFIIDYKIIQTGQTAGKEAQVSL